MGGAMIRALQAKGRTDLSLIDPALPAFSGISVFPDMHAYEGPMPQAVVLAIKPQMMEAALPR